ncbi:hypothetical protein [Actinomadura sp. NBRC 104412]|uniref:hypothetical protein n=1 Tax=Actinomadura sp. NBRC 104412 TaxID=3032203 RepID=UPI002555100C|nr:hypothetical protein [Actinomadura sp. NBRC 104412]
MPDWHAPLWRYLRGMAGSAHLADDLGHKTWVAMVLPMHHVAVGLAAGLALVVSAVTVVAGTALAVGTRHQSPDDGRCPWWASLSSRRRDSP